MKTSKSCVGATSSVSSFDKYNEMSEFERHFRDREISKALERIKDYRLRDPDFFEPNIKSYMRWIARLEDPFYDLKLDRDSFSVSIG